jgi:hypothetical protein
MIQYKDTNLYLSNDGTYIIRKGKSVDFNYNGVIRTRHTKDKMFYIKNIKPTKNGYCCINDIYVHRIIAELLIDNIDNKPQVNHKDRNRSNNTLDNLEWVTNKENVIHAWNNGRVHIIPPRTKEHSKKIWDTRRRKITLYNNDI